MSVVWLDGRLVPAAEARISPFDRGFLLGDAVFETMRVYAGSPFREAEHLARLRRTCGLARLPYPEDLPRAVRAVLEANALQEASVRITVSRGVGGRGASPRGAGPATLLVTASAVEPRPEVWTRGLHVVTASLPHATPLAGAKTTNYMANVLARIEAEEKGADDALFVDAAGHVVEATQANLFLVEGDALATPPLSSGCLPGVTRALLLQLAPSAGLRPVERPLRVADVAAADEAFLSASVLEVGPVVAVDGRRIGTGVPGEAARRLHTLYRKEAAGSPGAGRKPEP